MNNLLNNYYSVMQCVPGPPPPHHPPVWGDFLATIPKGNTSREEIFYIYKKGIKKACVPGDMLVLSVMTLNADLLRQIATDPHGFSRADSIGNGLFNFPKGALPFPRYASLKRLPLLDLVGQMKIFAERCITVARSLRSYLLIHHTNLFTSDVKKADLFSCLCLDRSREMCLYQHKFRVCEKIISDLQNDSQLIMLNICSMLNTT